MDNILKQNLSGQSFSHIDMSQSGEQPEDKSLEEKFYKCQEDIEAATQSSIKMFDIEQSSAISSIENDQIIKAKLFKNEFCEKCQMGCIVTPLESGFLIIECKCSRLENISPNEFKNDYLHGENNKDEYNRASNKNWNNIDLSYCRKHPQKRLIYYCHDCSMDICEECMKEDALYTNVKKKFKRCENHTLEKLEQNETIINDIRILMENIEKDIVIVDEDKKIMNDLFFIISCFIENYSQLQCYNSKKSIDNFKKFLEKVYKTKDICFKLKNREGSFKHLIKLNSENDIKKQMFNFRQVYSIQINKTYKNIDLSVLNNQIFPNLKEIIMRGNLIQDISFLNKSQFPCLEKIDIEENIINNDSIQVLDNSELPKLKYLNLFKNKITSIKIFDILKKFPLLETFYIGENKFDMEEIKYDRSTFTFPNDIKEFGITGNFKGNADFVKRLRIENLETFYISRNQISDLKCLKNINFIRLREFWAISNNITDINEIMNINGKENIRKINLKQNPINNFQELFNIIENFRNIKELGFVDNNITKEEAVDMEIRIKNAHNIDLKIEV